MTPAPLAAPHHRRAYDHRLREHVCRTGARALGHRLQIPRSTISSWNRRGLRTVVSHEVFDQDRQRLLSTVEKLERRARILAATVRLLLALLRASGFRLLGERLPQGATKASILRAVTSAHSALPLALILRILGMPPSRYYARRRRCGGLRRRWRPAPGHRRSRDCPGHRRVLRATHDQQLLPQPTDFGLLPVHAGAVLPVRVNDHLLWSNRVRDHLLVPGLRLLPVPTQHLRVRS